MKNNYTFELAGENKFVIPSTILDPSELSIQEFNQLEHLIENIQISLYLSFCKKMFDRFDYLKYISVKNTFSDNRGLINGDRHDEISAVINNSKTIVDIKIGTNPATLVKIYNCSDTVNQAGFLSITRENLGYIGRQLLGDDWLSSYSNPDYEPIGVRVVMPDETSVEFPKFPRLLINLNAGYEIDWLTQMDVTYAEILSLAGRLEREYIAAEIMSHLNEFPEDSIEVFRLSTENEGTLKATSVKSQISMDFDDRVNRNLSSMHFSVTNPKYSHFISSSKSVNSAIEDVFDFRVKLKTRNGYSPDGNGDKHSHLPGGEEIRLIQYGLYKLEFNQRNLMIDSIVNEQWIAEHDEHLLNKGLSALRLG